MKNRNWLQIAGKVVELQPALIGKINAGLFADEFGTQIQAAVEDNDSTTAEAVLADAMQHWTPLSKEEVIALIAETCKYLVLCKTAEQPLSPPKAIDAAWHELIQENWLYERISAVLFGEGVAVIYHQADDPDVAQNESTTPTLDQLFEMAQAAGLDPDRSIWTSHYEPACDGSFRPPRRTNAARCHGSCKGCRNVAPQTAVCSGGCRQVAGAM